MSVERESGSDRTPEFVVAESQEASMGKHLLTVVLEDYFHVAPLKSVVQTDTWYRFERRVETNTRSALDLLDEFGVSATFFILGSIADEMPELVREVANRGHEVASKGYFHRSIKHFGVEEFRDDLLRSREALERASGRKIHGYRIGHGWLSPSDLWALDVLAAEGFAYDSSIRPLFRRYAHEPWRINPHLHTGPEGELWELPLCSWTKLGWSMPISGGNYFRQFPHWLMRRAVSSWIQQQNTPFLMYFHVWELDPEQPRIQAAPLRERIRQYRNLDKMAGIIGHYLREYSFRGVADYLGIQPEAASPSIPERRPIISVANERIEFNDPPEQEKIPVSVVVPCYNEELILPYLANTLNSVRDRLSGDFDLKFVFVDDGSVDGTWDTLRSLFGERSDCVIERLQPNRGVAAAILTGIRQSRTEVVASIDCDCTYDPHQLAQLIPLLTDDVDMVTASPYHRDGVVRNVPAWRLFLSKSLSSFYRVVLNHSLATYTSCFRIYRRSAVLEVDIGDGGFLGVAEMLGRLDLQGGTIVECPAVLEVRLLGRSKMKTLRTIMGHLRLLCRLGFERLLASTGKHRHR